MFNKLLDEDPYVQQKEAEGEAKGEVKGLQRAVVKIVSRRFPALTELAQHRIAQFNTPDRLDFLVEKMLTAPDESSARWLLDSLARFACRLV